MDIAPITYVIWGVEIVVVAALIYVLWRRRGGSR
jgi:hypothetical protein